MDRKIMRFNRKTGTICAILLALLFLISGCKAISDFRQAYDTAAIEWHHPDDGFGRKVVILASRPASIPAGFMSGRNLSEMISKSLSDELSKTCSKMVVDIPEKEKEDNREAKTPFSLCARFRNVGANAVVSCDIESITAVSRRRGFWHALNPFGRSARKALEKKYPSPFKIRVRFTAWSTFTAAQIYDACLEETFDPADFRDDGKAGSGGMPGCLHAISRLCEKASDALCDAVFDQIWNSYVIGTDPGGLIVSAGSRVGLSTGTMLDVWSRGDVIKSADGNRFLLPGEKTGSVKVVEIKPDTAIVVSVSGKAPVVGSVVLKQGVGF